jgi:hypothetical protein
VECVLLDAEAFGSFGCHDVELLHGYFAFDRGSISDFSLSKSACFRQGLRILKNIGECDQKKGLMRMEVTGSCATPAGGWAACERNADGSPEK